MPEGENMNEVLTADEVASMLKVSRRTLLEKLSREEAFPTPLYGRRKPAWAAQAVQAWMHRASQRTENAHR